MNWIEKSNGNHVCIEDGEVIATVFRDRDGDWKGVVDGEFTAPFATAEEAIDEIEETWF